MGSYMVTFGQKLSISESTEEETWLKFDCLMFGTFSFSLVQVREICMQFSKEDLRWQVFALMALQEVRRFLHFLLCPMRVA